MARDVIEVIIKDEYITLGSFLKYTGIVSTGGEVKSYLLDNNVFVNNTLVYSRGFKVKSNSIIKIDSNLYKVIFKGTEFDD